ncbi:MAG: sigma-54-dependent Fis family transcriptional regulator [Myxococcales bacterium]|nr:sigma-54-dependent Fis family transcriptional regulator [Myxococcales bacterium]
MGRVLLVEDDSNLVDLLKSGLRRRGFEVVGAQSSNEALGVLEREDFDVVVTDVRMEGLDGLGLAERISSNRATPVILMTGHGDLETAIAGIRTGVYDFLQKPVAIETLVVALTRAVRHKQLTEELRRLRQLPDLDSSGSFGILGESPKIVEVKNLVRRVALADITVLVTGESGTGKELVARSIHDQSGRSRGPFIAINCAAVPAQLLESELFGHVRGAFTDAKNERNGLFLEAQGGTLFLDEIGDMPLDMQAKLLRALQDGRVRPVGGNDEKPFDARILTATNKDLENEIDEGRFREDLYYRINVVNISLPPLRARGNDVLLLAQHFVERSAVRLQRDVRGFSKPVAHRFLRYDWPGNIRELSNCIERAVALTRFSEITVDDLPERLRDYRVARNVLDAVPELVSLEEVERFHIERVLKAVEGNKSRAATILGVDRRTLYRKVERYGIQV